MMTPGRREARRWPYYLRLGVSAGLLLLTLLVAALAVIAPLLSGARPMTVLTGSMEPKLPVGTLIVVRPTDPDELRVGDVITYQLRSGEPEVVTHRIVAITTDGEERTFATRGDANPSPDAAPVREVQIRGRLWYAIPYLGYVNTIINGELRPWVIGIVAAALFVYAAWMIVSGVRDRRTRAAGDPLSPDRRDDDAID